jgi:hypothetical protein
MKYWRISVQGQKATSAGDRTWSALPQIPDIGRRRVAMFPAVRFALFATAKLARKDKQLARYSKLTSTLACYAMRLDPA